VKNDSVLKHATTRRVLLLASVAALVIASGGRAAAHDGDRRVDPPLVPGNLEVPAGYRAFLEGHAVGTQNFVCLSSGTTFAWAFFGPQATLFNDDDQQITTHFLSANPDEAGLARATWQHSRDTSSVWAFATPDTTSTDPRFVRPGAIPWLRLQVVGDEEGPTGGNKLTPTGYIHRVNTVGGIAPATGCAAAADVGKKALVPYQADYVFYRYGARADHGDH
jgi:hypothetical protein